MDNKLYKIKGVSVNSYHEEISGGILLRLFIFRLINDNNSGQLITPNNNLLRNLESRSIRRSLSDKRYRKCNTLL